VIGIERRLRLVGLSKPGENHKARPLRYSILERRTDEDVPFVLANVVNSSIKAHIRRGLNA